MKQRSIRCKAEAFLYPCKKQYQIKGGSAGTFEQTASRCAHGPDPSCPRLTGRPSLISVLFRAGFQKIDFSAKCHITRSFLHSCSQKLFLVSGVVLLVSCVTALLGEGQKRRWNTKNKIVIQMKLPRREGTRERESATERDQKEVFARFCEQMTSGIYGG